MSIDLEKARARLIAMREELEKESQDSEADRAPVDVDQQSVGRLSRMDALQQQAMAQATERHRTAELARIDAALKRIDQGDYGLCVKCDEPIAEKRLEIDPAAVYCVDCASGG